MICNYSPLCSDVSLRMTGSVAHGIRRSDGAAGHGNSPFYSIIKLNAGPGGTAIFTSHLYFHLDYLGPKCLIQKTEVVKVSFWSFTVIFTCSKLLLLHIVTCRLVCFIECMDMEVILNLMSVCAHVRVCVQVLVYTTICVPKSAFY